MKRLPLSALFCICLLGCPRDGPRNPNAPFGGWRICYIPTESVVVEKMLDMAKVGKNDIVYDLGCGDGRIVCIAAKKYGAKGVGVDIIPERHHERTSQEAAAAGLIASEWFTFPLCGAPVGLFRAVKAVS